jgi:hypothetical protein
VLGIKSLYFAEVPGEIIRKNNNNTKMGEI